jgi:hypothetical protein
MAVSTVFAEKFSFSPPTTQSPMNFYGDMFAIDGKVSYIGDEVASFNTTGSISGHHVSKTMYSIVQCIPTESLIENELNTFKVVASKNGNTTLKPTVLNNPDIRYDGASIGLLVGSNPDKQPTDHDVYPVIIERGEVSLVKSFESGDSDKDNLADAWELVHFGSIDVSDGSTDYDNDGYLDSQEYANSSDPKEKNDAGGSGYNELTDYRVTNLDVDGNGIADGGTDGLLLIRYIFRLTGDNLLKRAIANDASRKTEDDIMEYLNKIEYAILDVDGNGRVDAGTDGLLLIRYLFGLTGDNLIMRVIADDASRTTAEEIINYLEPMTP